VEKRKIPAHHRQAFAEVDAWREDKKLFGIEIAEQLAIDKDRQVGDI
jgi:hypothetical protein